jgi:predicted dehydrogenase
MAACGGVADLTLDAARRSPDFDVVAIQDTQVAALMRVGERYGIARRFHRFEELLTDDVDFVIVNSPNHVHLEHVRTAVGAGKACLVQKPMAPTLSVAEEMVRAAADRGVPLGVTMFELGKPLHHQVREMVRSGWLGAPTLVQSISAHDIYLKDPPEPGDWRRNALKVGGGAFIQLAIHHVNLAAWILGREVEKVSAVGARRDTVFEDEATLASVLFEGGTPGHFAASYAADLYSFAICGTEGRIQITPGHVTLKGERQFEGEIFDYLTPGREAGLPIADMEPAIAARRDAVEVHGAFARWLDGRGEFWCTGGRGLRDMRVVDAVYRSRGEEAWVSVD